MNLVSSEVFNNHVVYPMINDIPQGQETEQQLRENVLRLSASIARSFWELGKMLARISEEKLYLGWGFKTFEDYLTRECDIGRVNAFQLKKTYAYFASEIKDAFVNDGAGYANLIAAVQAAGPTKALLVANKKAASPQRAKLIVDHLQNLTVPELKEQLDLLSDKIPSQEDLSVPPVVRKSYKFTAEELDHVETAITKVLSVLPPDEARPALALAKICAAFEEKETGSVTLDAQEPPAAESQAEVTENVINNRLVETLLAIEEEFGVSLIAVSRLNDKILFGETTFQKLGL